MDLGQIALLHQRLKRRLKFDEPVTQVLLNQVQLAISFAKLPAAIQLRAIMEDWGLHIIAGVVAMHGMPIAGSERILELIDV